MRWITRIAATAVIAGLAASGALLTSSAAEARVFVGFGFGFPIGFPGYYYPPYPSPYYYPPPAYYPPPPAYYPQPGSYQQPAQRPPSGYAPSAASPNAPITYTPRRAWTDASGRPCREYKTTREIGGRATPVYGTACRVPDGQWRAVN